MSRGASGPAAGRSPSPSSARRASASWSSRSARPAEVQCAGTARPVHSIARTTLGEDSLSSVTTVAPSRLREVRRLAERGDEPVQYGRGERQQPLVADARGQREQPPSEAVLARLLVALDEAGVVERAQRPRHLRLLAPHELGDPHDAQAARVGRLGRAERREDVDHALEAHLARGRHAGAVLRAGALSATPVAVGATRARRPRSVCCASRRRTCRARRRSRGTRRSATARRACSSSARAAR